MLNVDIQNVIKLSVVMLSVLVVSLCQFQNYVLPDCRNCKSTWQPSTTYPNVCVWFTTGCFTKE